MRERAAERRDRSRAAAAAFLPHGRVATKTHRQTASRVLPFWLQIVAALAVVAFGAVSAGAEELSSEPVYVGSEACQSCHEAEFAAWRGSHHGWALREATVENVLGQFDGETLEFGSVTARFYRDSDRFMVETEGPDAALTAFEILYTVGVTPLQQYLVELEGGRLQALDIAWDVAGGRWYHLYPGEIPAPGDGLHWTGPYKNWQARCAVCHQTDFVKGYDPVAHDYHSSWSELTVGCEACHGPGSRHLEWAEASAATSDDADYEANADIGFAFSLAQSLRNGNTRAIAETCATCHSLRTPLGPDSPVHGSAYADNYELALLREGSYFADGQIDGEVYVYGSFLQSKMHAAGVTCTNCHNPHSAELVADGNAVCTQCHNPEGNTDFPTAPKGLFDDPAHHFHPMGSEAAQCVSCHMPSRTYMIVDPRRDHSFRIPNPAQSAAVGAPDACTACHDDKSQDWAAMAIREWYLDSEPRIDGFAETLHSGRLNDDRETRDRLLALLANTDQPGIIRATAVELLGWILDADVVSEFQAFIDDDDPMVRSAIAKAMRFAPPDVRGATVAPLLGDPIRSVRISAAVATIDLGPDGLVGVDPASIVHARGEWQAMLHGLSDFPETHLQIGGVALAQRNVAAAWAAYQEATRMDPQLVDAWMMLGRIGVAIGDLEAAEQQLRMAVDTNPNSALLLQSLGNVLSDRGKLQEAVDTLGRAIGLASRDPDLRIDLAFTLSRAGDDSGALRELTFAQALGANSPEFFELLAVTQARLGKAEAARRTVVRLLEVYPGYSPIPELAPYMP